MESGPRNQFGDPCSNLTIFGSKYTALKVFATLLGLFSALQWFGARGVLTPLDTPLQMVSPTPFQHFFSREEKGFHHLWSSFSPSCVYYESAVRQFLCVFAIFAKRSMSSLYVKNSDSDMLLYYCGTKFFQLFLWNLKNLSIIVKQRLLSPD